MVSGINHGANLGDDVIYSGTVAAAMEGRFLGLPTIAVSLASEEVIDDDSVSEPTNVGGALNVNCSQSQSTVSIRIPYKHRAGKETDRPQLRFPSNDTYSYGKLPTSRE